MKILKKIKNMFTKEHNATKIKKLTLDEMVEYINKEYHFILYDENLISEIYSKLLDYGNLSVIKEDQYKYIIELRIIDKDFGIDDVYNYEVTQKGIKRIQILDED